MTRHIDVTSTSNDRSERINPALDAEGLHVAFWELLEEARLEEFNPPDGEEDPTPFRLRSMAEGYYVWAGYIVWLEKELTGPHATQLSPLDDAESLGLSVLRDVMNEHRALASIQPCGSA